VLTRTGWGVAAWGAVSAALGVTAGVAVPVVVGVAALCLVLFSWTLSRLPVRLSGELELERHRVTVGEPATARLVVRNESRRPSPPMWGRLDALGEVVPLAIPALAASAERVIELPLPTRRRASGSVGPVHVTSADPFRLSRHAVRLGDAHEFFVWPRRAPVSWGERGLMRPTEGTVSGGLQDDPLSFAGLRPYVVGDDVRLVHWPSVARTGDLVVRRTLQVSPQRLEVALEVRSDRWDPARFEHGVSIAASLLESADAAGIPWGVLFGADRVPGSGRSTADLVGVMDRLAGVRTEPAAAALDVAAIRDATVVVITGRTTPEDHGLLAVLAPRVASLVLVEVVDPFARAYAPSSSSVEVLRVASLEQFAAESVP
jgi:uncharacterized protein (DUF58 family)